MSAAIWRGGRGGRGSLGNALLLASVLGELPIFDQQIKTGAASVGLLVRPFVHAKLAIDEDFLALLNEVPGRGGRALNLGNKAAEDPYWFT